MVHRRRDGTVDVVVIIHVDDLMIASDGSRDAEARVQQLHDRFPFGEWVEVSKAPGGVLYTGKNIKVVQRGGKLEVEINQQEFIEGRMNKSLLTKEQQRDSERALGPKEITEYRSGVGDMHWTTQQTRIDMAVTVNKLQKKQTKATIKDLKEVNKAIDEIKKTSTASIRIQPMSRDIAIVAWHDSALYGSQGELIEDDEALKGFDKHSVYSQAGILLGIMEKSDIERDGDLPVNFFDWRTRASRRVVISTFAAEVSAGVEALGMAKFARAFYGEIYHGGSGRLPTDYDETVAPIKMVTDCKSVFDHLKKEGAVPDDRWTALYVAALKCGVSCGPERDLEKAACLWVPSRWQLADVLTKLGLSSKFREIMAAGRTRLHEVSAQELRRRRLTGYRSRRRFWSVTKMA